MESVHMTIVVPKDMHERLKILAENDRRSLSQFVRLVLQEKYPNINNLESGTGDEENG